jgi:hypothetical protein
MRDSTALRFVVLLGIVSLLADITYEGARGITGPHLAPPGAGAAVAEFAPPERRASAYGAFSFCFGTAWFAGSAAMGLLYGRSIAAVAVFAIALQLAGGAVVARLRRAR